MVRSIFGAQKIYLSRWTGKIEKWPELLEDVIEVAHRASVYPHWPTLNSGEAVESAS
jgi:hypothetical protein